MSKKLVWNGWAPKRLVAKVGGGRNWARSTVLGKTVVQGLSDASIQVMHNLSVSRKDLLANDQPDAVRVRVTVEVIDRDE